jgi:hypothetical protein
LFGATGVARRERDVETDGLAGELAQHRFDPPCVLMADPVELEAVRHPQRHHRGFALVGDFGVWKRPDPGVELLVRQLRRQAFAAALPEIGSHVWRSRPLKPPIVDQDDPGTPVIHRGKYGWRRGRSRSSACPRGLTDCLVS